MNGADWRAGVDRLEEQLARARAVSERVRRELAELDRVLHEVSRYLGEPGQPGGG